MQRSRKALLTRRASWKTNEKNFLYKVSSSLALFLWGLIFLPNIRIHHHDGYKDGFLDLPKGFKTWDEFKLNHQNLSCIYLVVISNESMMNDRNPTQFSFTNEEPKEIPYSKTKRLRSATLDLGEFKNKAFTISTKTRGSNDNVGPIIHRLEPSGAEYNYASTSKGAKILGHNKEAKGTSNLLSNDKNKYLRNPCSSNQKFVVLELSEEMLVDTVEIANFEHHSSNPKGFELYGSMVYPTEYWVELGNFTARNVKHLQRFILHGPKWVRYLKLNLLSHFGSDFYCTLSILRVYGVDAVEMMLEDLVIARNNEFLSEELDGDRKPDEFKVEPETEPELEPWLDEFNANRADVAANVPDPLLEVRQQQVGRLPGDSVLKILMQKVRVLDIDITLLERFLDDLTARYNRIFQEIDVEIGERDVIVEEIRKDLRVLHDNNDIWTKHVDDLVLWKSLVSVQLDNIIQDNAFLRSEVAKVRENQEHLEDKGVVMFVVSLIFGSLAMARLFLVNILFIYNSKDRCRPSIVEFWQRDYSSGFLLLSCTTIIVITSFGSLCISSHVTC